MREGRRWSIYAPIITAAVAFAEIYAESHPQHADALRHCYEDITKSFHDLREVVYGRPIME